MKFGLFFCGFSLIFLQLVMNWHLGPVLHSSELPWLLLSCTALLGQAAGYGWRNHRWPQFFLAFTLLAPLLACLLRACQFPPWTTLLLSAGLAFLSSSPLAFQISQLWQGDGLRNFYRVELAGALAALLTALMLSPQACTTIFPWVVLLSSWSRLNSLGRWLTLSLCALECLAFPRVCWWAAERTYAPDRLLAQQLSAYQYVEVVDTLKGRYFFLNGLCHYGPEAYNHLNFYLGPLAVSRLSESARRQGCLVLGAGTFQAPALVAEQGLSTRVVELDPSVVELGLEYFEKDRPRQARFTTLTGDARLLLNQQPETGLIVINLPSPYSLNVASMFTREFYGNVRAKLAPGGVCSVFLGAPLEPSGPNRVQGPILAALLEAFPETVAISGKAFDNTVILSSAQGLGTPEDLRTYLRSQGKNRFTIYSRSQLIEMNQGFSPASLNDLSLCAELNRLLWKLP